MRGIRLMAAVSMMLCARAALAGSQATFSFYGSILAPSCVPDPATLPQVITLATVPVAEFVATTSGAKAFVIELSGCQPQTPVSMSVSGTIDTFPTVLKNLNGSATQVGVQLLLASGPGATTGTPIPVNGDAVALGTSGPTGTMIIPLVAQYYRLGALSAGTVGVMATVTFTYN
ncbi:fimbrial protein [Caballeronia sp. LZ034LL]|uniref:fimbrial protein n=1 Tax=Caballeronia sp. LZ034LL TaxID=3038567 RepID=UPI00286570D2|nr:fimbrial protein [Caballeronia sp. LZ034LL]MDR5833374.1 fimbrial protein [Caballeronia sp. LZ034LL]